MDASETSTFVSGDGHGYELQMGRWSQRLAPLLIDFAGLSSAQCVLDVGCGTGSLSFALARNPEVGGICGLDRSAEYVEYAERKNSDARLRFQVGDACELPFRDASFDHALSMLMLQFIPSPDLAVAEMRRVTRPGGTVTTATWDTRGGFVAYRMISDTAAMLDERGSAWRARSLTRPMSRPSELQRAWIAAGLVNVAQDMRTIRMDFACFDDFWSPAESREGPIAEFVATLDNAAKAALREAVRLAYLDGEDDGPRSYAATAWVVRGEVPR
jgi:ubiquinone/menaquinone biosynthesis C-methylase UbiE